jgi:hypothetical protein
MKTFKYLSPFIVVCSLIWSKTGLISVGTIENNAFYKLSKIAVSNKGLFILDVGDQTVFHYTGEKTACLHPLNYGGGVEYPRKSIEKRFTICSTHADLTSWGERKITTVSFDNE